MMPRILIVDDHAPAHDVLARLLRSRGWEVDEAGDLQTALDVFDDAPDHTILNLMLPGGGVERILAEIQARA